VIVTIKLFLKLIFPVCFTHRTRSLYKKKGGPKVMVVCSVCNSEMEAGAPCPVCAQDKKDKLFYSSKLRDSSKPDIITVRLNMEERFKLEAIKKALDIPLDSSALKELAFMGLNVIQATFSPDFLKWLCDKKRVRLSDNLSRKGRL